MLLAMAVPLSRPPAAPASAVDSVDGTDHGPGPGCGVRPGPPPRLEPAPGQGSSVIGVDQEPADGLLSVGIMAARSGLTPKALRHYDRIRLLRPVQVDDATGYPPD